MTSRFYPRLEALEDRRLPSTANVWVAPGSSGNWNTAINWSLSHVPASTEIATFDGSSAAVCTIDAPAMGTNAVSGINITSGYLGPIQVAAAIVIGPDGFVQAGGSFAVTGSGNLDLGGANRAFTVGGTLSISAQITNGGLSKAGPGILLLSHANSYSAGTSINAGTLRIGDDIALGAGTLTMADGTTIAVTGANHSLANPMAVNGNVTVGASANTLTFNGVVSGPGSLIVNGNLILNGNNSYAGTTTVNAAVLTIGGNSPLGGGSLILNAGSSLVPPASSSSISNGVTLNGPATFGGSNDFIFAGPVTGAGSLTDTNPSTVTLGTDSNFSGSVIVTVGTISYFGTSGTLVLDAGTTLLASAQTLSSSITFNGNAIIGFPTSNLTMTISGALSGSGGFTMVGSFLDWLILTGTSTYFGPTFVNGGLLIVRGSQPNSPIVINNMGELIGSGTVGDVTLNNGNLIPAQFGPGVTGSPAILRTGNLKLNGGVVNMNALGTTPGTTGYSQLIVNGNVDLGQGVAFMHMSSSVLPHSTKLRLIENLGPNPINSFFFGTPEGSVISGGQTNFAITYKGDTGNDMVATAITYDNIIGRETDTGQWWLGISNASSFSNSPAMTWSTTPTWVDVQSGDFNGDGFTDIVGRYLETGQWWVAHRTSSGGFTNSLWTTWSTNVTWVDVKVGDFDGDGKMDIAGRALETGQWWVALSTGSSFTNHLWATWNPAAEWVDVQVGDFNGDGKADITGRYLQGGQWWTAISSGSDFNTTLWTTWNPAATWIDVKAGDFNGDGKTDIAGRVAQNGVWWIGTSTGSSFTNLPGPMWSTAVTWVDVLVGDFNGDGRADLVGRVLETGEIWVSLGAPTPSGFTTSLWDSWNPAVTWVDVQVGDFNADGKSDITGRFLEGGSWWTGVSSGAAFSTTHWGDWSTAVTLADVQNGFYV